LSTIELDLSCVYKLEKESTYVPVVNDLFPAMTYTIKEKPATDSSLSAQVSPNGCYKEPKLAAGLIAKGTKQSDFQFTNYFTPNHELTTIHVCTNSDKSLRGLQFQASIHASTQSYDSFDLFALGNMHTEPRDPMQCFSDYVFDEVTIKNATVYFNDTQVTAISFLYSNDKTRQYGSIYNAQYSQRTMFSLDS
jgi:hypothetical protein